MLSRKLIASLPVAVLLAAAGPAAAAPMGFGLTNGNTTPPSYEHCPPGDATILGGAPFHDIDLSGPAVLTKFDAKNIGAPGAPLVFRVARIDRRDPRVPGWNMVASVPAKLDATGSVEVPARIPVQNADRLALTKAAGAQVACAMHTTGENPFVAVADGLAPDGTSTAFTTVRDRFLPIGATVELDTDADGFGDDTQDKCVGEAGPADGCLKAEAPAKPACTVPRLVGLKLAAARQRLAAGGCRVGKVTRASGAGAKVVVRRQSRAAGSQAPKGTKVDLKLGSRRG